MDKISTASIKRLRELDFLRGLAIILVLFQHIPFSKFTSTIGWIGVDLFFVLSGFLISGLLFREYQKFGNINPWLFLVRRAFKIYPIYYLFMLPYLGIKIFYFHRFYLLGFIYDSTFVQNYFLGWGYACPASWSLAVEEHFYFGFSILLWIVANKLNLDIRKSAFYIVIITILFIVFGIRYASNALHFFDVTRLYTATHLRIDSLFMGVLISYFYYFKNDLLIKLYHKNKRLLKLIMLAGLAWTPFFVVKESFFANTFGFSLLYISFGILLLIFILEQSINQTLDKFFSKQFVSIVSNIGLASFSIYYIHSFFIFLYDLIKIKYSIFSDNIISCSIIFLVSILSGILMTSYIEKYFLKIRDKYFPSRVI